MVFSWIQASWSKVKSVLKKTTDSLANRLKTLFCKPLDAETKEELEKLFYAADLGVSLTRDLLLSLEKTAKECKEPSADLLLKALEDRLLDEFKTFDFSLKTAQNGPTVFIIIGANGHGKTTSIAKLAHMLKKEGKTVLLAACDTFRAAAQEQLEIWADRVGCPLIKGQYQQDPASVAFDAIQSAKAKHIDYVIIDTAGRLENKVNLIKELQKIVKICTKACPNAPHETLLVLDATIGQNSEQQAKIFNEATPLSGLILTKLDGSAKGGIALAIQKNTKIPAKCIGTGESLEDFALFEPKSFIQALLGTDGE